jgi:hypothetical protein
MLGARATTVAIVLAICAGTMACGKGPPRGREAAPGRDVECRDSARPKAYFYPAGDRTRYGPDDPQKDGCEILVPDHLFCCPRAENNPAEVKP